MKRILYIDAFCPAGHLALNRVYISKLVEEGFTVSLALKVGYNEQLGMTSGAPLKVEVPPAYYDKSGSLRSRFYLWMILRFIRDRIDEDQYDVIFFSSYEEISLWAAHFRKPCVLVNHANVAALDRGVRRWFAHRLVRRGCTWLVFADFIRQRVLHHGITRVHVVPQGLVERHRPAPGAQELLGSIDKRLVAPWVRHLVFIPSGAKYDDKFIPNALSKPAFQRYLEASGIALAVKSEHFVSESRNVVLIRKYLSAQQYKALFVSSTCLVLHYPVSFNYRVSATLIECFSNEKACLVSDIDSFRAFARNFRYDPFYDNTESLCAALDRLLAAGTDLLSAPYQYLDEQVPSFIQAARAWAVPAPSRTP